MSRRTKIVATLGPATESREVLEQLIRSGVDVVRLNFSHGTAGQHVSRAALVRDIAAKHGRFVAILADLQGPKIRISRFASGKVLLERGQLFTLDATLDKEAGDAARVGIDYEALVSDSRPGDILLLDDGRLVFKVKDVQKSALVCEVVVGGTLSNNKGINRKGGGLSASALTEKDCADIKIAASMQADYLAVSFPRDAEDIHHARRLLNQAGSNAALVAKIERAEAVENAEALDEIILASDAVMVARGDLGVEIGDVELVGMQKYIIERARVLNRVVITATQMMETMINQTLPTRAEVFDVANAVLDGTDAVMLSAETATGMYPVQTVEAMGRIILGAEKHRLSQQSGHRLNQVFRSVDETIALSAMYAANHLDKVKAVICLTASGNTPKLMSRIRSHLPIYAISSNPRTLNRVALYRGVIAFEITAELTNSIGLDKEVILELFSRRLIANDDVVLITSGVDYIQGSSNILRILRVGDVLE